MNRLRRAALVLCGAFAVPLLLVWWLGVRDDVALPSSDPVAPPSAEMLDRGAYLARAGNCMFCHTRRGGAAYAGGRGIVTPFGTVFSSNLTPDVGTGLGDWTPTQFWRAMHHGRSRGGRLLTPVFPYSSFTQITRADADAIFAHLQSQPPVAQANRAHQLRWPYNSQLALALWRALYFRPESFQADPARGDAWNRGAYLVRALGHCNACHATRNVLGAIDDPRDLAGGPIPMQRWYAPSLLRSDEAGLADWQPEQIVRLLQTGVSQHGAVSGPMAEVVLHSLQYLRETDLAAMAHYLKHLPSALPADRRARAAPVLALASPEGATLYEKHCAGCHGERGEGVAGAYAALAGNRAVLLADPTNLMQMVLYGGFAPATLGNPRPFGMPPYLVTLSDREVAVVLTHIRGSWGNQAGAVSEFDVVRHRGAGR